jgi:hypothetical protein
MQTVFRSTVTVSDIVDRVLAYAEQYGENPLDLGLTLEVNLGNWWIAMEMDAPYDWPQGSDDVDWSEGRYASPGDAFDELLEAGYLRQHTPSWDALKTTYDALLSGLHDCTAWPPLSEEERVAHLTEIHHRLARLWHQIDQRRALDANLTRRALRAARNAY